MSDSRLRVVRDPLIGKTVELPDGVLARVDDIEHEYDDGTTLTYLTGPSKGGLTMRDTFAVRRYPVSGVATGGDS